MAQIVNYNGARLSFPDGMPPAEIAAAIKRSVMSLPAMKAKAPDPSEGGLPFRPFGIDTGMAMPQGPSRFLAGAGKAFADLGRGAGQIVGAVSREDVAESRERDAPLMNTGAGLAGNITGNVAALVPAAFIPGAATVGGAAAIGAGSGWLQPSISTSETLMNVGIGGAAAPAAIIAGRGLVAGYQGAMSLAEPMTKAGQKRIAASVLQASATNPTQAAANALRAKPLVPGSSPTLAQIADDPGLAQLERTMLNNPEYTGPLQQRFAAQRSARLESVKDVAGTPEHYDAIKQGRSIFANEDYGNALAQGIDPGMAKAMAPQIENLMARPSLQKAQGTARWLAAEQGKTIDSFGSLEGLDWLKKALDNQISKASIPGSAIGKEELRALTRTKSDLMATLEQIAPGYKEANDAYAAMSRQVNSMDVGRSLLDKLQKPGSEYMGGSAREMGADFSRSLSLSQDSVKKATGMNKTISDVMSTRDIAQLENVALDLGRKSFAETQGKATGSNTAQNLASQNMLRRMLGPAGLPESWAESSMLQALLSPVQMASKLTGADRRIMDRIAMGLLDPTDAATLLTASRPAQRGLLGAPAQRLLPAGTGGLLSVQFPE